MPDIPEGITRGHVEAAIQAIDRGVQHEFGKSTKYDLLFGDRRYPPKAVLGLAAASSLGRPLGPYDFKGGLGSKCFRILTRLGFTIVPKVESSLFPEEVPETCVEGARQRVYVNRYERNAVARARCIAYYGATCRVCEADFEDLYGSIGEGFIHVHHLKSIAEVGRSYEVDPISDLTPVCPNCHAMIHRMNPVLSIEQLQDIVLRHRPPAS